MNSTGIKLYSKIEDKIRVLEAKVAATLIDRAAHEKLIQKYYKLLTKLSSQ